MAPRHSDRGVCYGNVSALFRQIIYENIHNAQAVFDSCWTRTRLGKKKKEKEDFVAFFFKPVLMNIVSTSGDHPHGSYVSSFI